MAALDPSALERELEVLRKQRYEASQRVRASRQPQINTSLQARNLAGDAFAPRSPLGSGRYNEHGFGGPPPSRGDGPRPGNLHEAGRLGPAPGSRGTGFNDAVPRGARYNGGPASRDGAGPGGRDHDDYSRDRHGPTAAAAAPPAAPPRRRAVLSMVVREKDPQRRSDADANADQSPEDRNWDRDHNRDHDRDRVFDKRQRAPWHSGEDRPPREPGGWGSVDERRDQHWDEGGGRGTKRAASPPPPPASAAGNVAEDPDSRKRARRLLGRALLGTLAKFRQEDAQFQASEAAARRAEAARKAEEKATAESERLRRAAAEERARQRQAELEALMDINLATDIKVLELLYAKKLARRRALAAFLRADGASLKTGSKTSHGSSGGGAPPSWSARHQPQPVYWLPAKHCEVTLSVKERQERELRDWEEAVLAELELEKDGLRQRSAARRAGIAERRQRAMDTAGRGAANPPGAEEDEDHEDREALEGVELDAHHNDQGPQRAGAAGPAGNGTGARAHVAAEHEAEAEVAVDIEMAREAEEEAEEEARAEAQAEAAEATRVGASNGNGVGSDREGQQGGKPAVSGSRAQRKGSGGEVAAVAADETAAVEERPSAGKKPRAHGEGSLA